MKYLQLSLALLDMVQKNKTLACPCGRGTYATCCEPFHTAVVAANTAESLMRSRYSAYALGLSSYVQSTWHASTRPAQLDLQQDIGQGKWIGLTVRQHSTQGEKAEVEFIARYKPNAGPANRLHERSRFVHENGQWYYVDGDLFET